MDAYVCPHCFNDEGLKKRILEIRPDFPSERCTFHPRYKGIPCSAVAEIIDIVFRYQYSWGQNSSYGGEMEGDPLDFLVEDITGAVDSEIAKALAHQLIEDENVWPPDGEEAFYANDQNYISHDPSYWHHSQLWKNFCKSITHGQRFFNADAKELITEIFDGIQFQRDHQKLAPIYEIAPGSAEGLFYRARIAEHEASLEKIMRNPAQELGPPPERNRRAGRMNSAGIGCFYAAYDFPTCVAELRPAVGSRVVGARFELSRPIFVLDTTRFEAPMKPLSAFSKHYMARVEQWNFMQSFCREIAKPISKNDEHLDYIPTQAVAEYLLHHHSFKRGGKPAKIEAIIFQSAQLPGGRNIALLGEAAHLQQSTPKHTKEEVRTTANEMFPEAFETFLEKWPRVENPAIHFAEDSVEVHRVTGAHYDIEQLYVPDFDKEPDF